MDKIEFKNDWLAINLLNQDVTMDALIANNVNSSNTGVKPKEDYLEIPKVKELFTENGVFDEKRFNEYYDKALASYITFAQTDQEKWLGENYEKHMFDITRKPEDNVQSYDYTIQQAINPLETSNFFYKRTESPRAKSIAELAQKNKYFDNETRKWADKSPNELGAIGALTKDTLILAQYDEDGTHTDSFGNVQTHKKGDYKLNDDGKFYYETANGRDTRNKQTLGVLDVLTTDGSVFNRFDVFDQDDIKTPAYKSVLRTMVLAAPYLASVWLPGFGQYYALSTAAMALTEAMPSIIKTFNGLFDADYTPSKTLNKYENFTKKFETTKSEYVRDHQWAFDNICTFISDSFAQLFQQRAIANVPKYLGFDERLKKGVEAIQKESLEEAIKKGLISREALEKMSKEKVISPEIRTIMESMPEYKNAFELYNNYTKYSTALSRAYLVATSASNVYNDSLNLGFDARQSSLISLGTMLSFDALFRTDYMKRFLLTGSMVDDDAMAVRQLAYGYLKTLGKEQLPKIEYEKGALGLVKKMRDKSTEWFQDVLYGGKHNIATAAFSEGIEETIEEVATDVNKLLFGNGLNAIREQLGYSTQGEFDYTKSKPLDRYFTSFIGGAIGGSVFGAETMWRERKREVDGKLVDYNAWNRLMSDKAELSSELIRKINSGHADEIVDFAKSLKNSTFLNKSLTFAKDEKGNFKPTNDLDESQNGVIINSFINYVKALDRFLEQEGIKYSESDSTDRNVYRSLTAISFTNALNQELGIGSERKYLDIVSQDLNRLQLKMYDLQSQIAAITDTKDDTKLEALRAEYGIVKQRFNNLKEGKNEDVFGMIVASSIPQVFSTLTASNVESYAKTIFGKDYTALNDTWKEIIDSHYKKYIDSGQHQKDAWYAYQLYTESSKKIANELNSKKTKDAIWNNSIGIVVTDDLEVRYAPTAPLLKTGLQYNDLFKTIYDSITKAMEANERDTSDAFLAGVDIAAQNIPIETIVQILTDYFFARHNSRVSGVTLGKYDYADLKYGYNIPVDLSISTYEWLASEITNEFNDSNEEFVKTLEDFKLLKEFDGDTSVKIEFSDIKPIIKALGIEGYDVLFIEIEKAKQDPDNYTLNPAIAKQLENVKASLEFLGILIAGAANVNRSAGSLTTVNAVINKFRQDNKIDKDFLAEIDANTATDYLNQMRILITQFETLQQISGKNASKENKHERLLSAHIKRIIRDDVYKLLNDKKFEGAPNFEIEELDTDLDELDEDELKTHDLELEQTQIKNEQTLYTFYNSLSEEDKIKFIKYLTELYPKFEAESEFLSREKTVPNTWTHKDVFPFWYVLCNIVTDTSVFYENYSVCLNEGLEYAPYYSQDLVSKLAVQFFTAEQNDIDLIFNALKDSVKNDGLFAEGFYAASNIFRISAGAGVGKTYAITPLTISILKKIDKNKKLVFSAPKKQHLDKLTDSDRKITLSELFGEIQTNVKFKIDGEIRSIQDDKLEELFTEDRSSFLQWVQDLELIVPDGSSLKDFLSNSLLVIDEGTYLSQYQYGLLDKLASLWNFKIFTIGDILQTGKRGNFDHVFSFIGPTLYSSKRAGLSIVKHNQMVLNDFVLSNGDKAESLHYANTPEGNWVGIKTTASPLKQEDVNTTINNLPEKASVLVYTKNKNLLFDRDNITTIHDISILQEVVDVQGGTYDYVIIDEDLKNIKERQVLNTLLSRNTQGTCIFGGCYLECKEIPYKNVVTTSLNDAAIKEYGEYRKEQVQNLNWAKLEETEYTEEPDDTEEAGTEDLEVEVKREDKKRSTKKKKIKAKNNKLERTLKTAKVKTTSTPKIPNTVKECVKMYSFHNRLGGKITEKNGIYTFTSDLENEDLPLMFDDKSVLKDGIDVHSKEFITAMTKLNIWKNQLLFNLESERQLPKELQGGKYLVKLTKYNPNYDDMLWKEEYNEMFAMKEGETFKRVVYQLPDGKEITVLTFPNNAKLYNANSDNVFTKYITKNMKLKKNESVKYFEIDTKNINFIAPYRPIYFEYKDTNKNHNIYEPFSVKFVNQKVVLPVNFSFMQVTSPVRLHSDMLLQLQWSKLGDKTLNETYNTIDQLYVKLDELFRSIPGSNQIRNPFRQRPKKDEQKGSVRKISRVKAEGSIQTFTTLNDGSSLTFKDAFNTHLNDLANIQTHLSAQLDALKTLSKEKDVKRIESKLKEFVENSEIRIQVQPLTLNDIYTHSSEDRFKSDVRTWFTERKSSRHFGGMLVKMLKKYGETLKKNGQPVSSWLMDISKHVDDTLEQAINFGATNTSSLRDVSEIANTAWKAFKTLYDINGNIKPEFESDVEAKNLYYRVYKYYYNPDFETTEKWDVIYDDSDFVSDGQFAYERGWSTIVLTGDVGNVFKELPSEKPVSNPKPKAKSKVQIKPKTNEPAEPIINPPTVDASLESQEYVYTTFVNKLDQEGNAFYKKFIKLFGEDVLKTFVKMSHGDEGWDKIEIYLRTQKGMNDKILKEMQKLGDFVEKTCEI